MDADNASLRERLEDDDKYEAELRGQTKELERKVTDLESKVSATRSLRAGSVRRGQRGQWSPPNPPSQMCCCEVTLTTRLMRVWKE